MTGLNILTADQAYVKSLARKDRYFETVSTAVNEAIEKEYTSAMVHPIGSAEVLQAFSDLGYSIKLHLISGDEDVVDFSYKNYNKYLDVCYAAELSWDMKGEHYMKASDAEKAILDLMMDEEQIIKALKDGAKAVEFKKRDRTLLVKLEDGRFMNKADVDSVTMQKISDVVLENLSR